MDESTILAHSCPPINYPEPQYYIRGRQEDPVSKSVLNVWNYQSGVNTILTDANGHYTITLSNDWIEKKW